jgi:hypothetical protein
MGFLGLRKVDQRKWTWRGASLQFLMILGCFLPVLGSGRPVWLYWTAVVSLSVTAVVMGWRIWRDRNSIDPPYVPEFPRPGVWLYVVVFTAVILGFVVGFYDAGR